MVEGVSEALMLIIVVMLFALLVGMYVFMGDSGGSMAQDSTATMCVNMPGLTNDQCEAVANDPNGPGS